MNIILHTLSTQAFIHSLLCVLLLCSFFFEALHGTSIFTIPMLYICFSEPIIEPIKRIIGHSLFNRHLLLVIK